MALGPLLSRAYAPYASLAFDYDKALGFESFRHTRRLFERLMHDLILPFASAADVGCGTGLFAKYLSRRWGVPVFGVDASPAMLSVAKRNCSGERVHLSHQDFRCFRLPEPVDLITANFDTINHLVEQEDLDRAFRCVEANLRPGGHFVFDFLTHCQPFPIDRPFLRRLRGATGEIQQWFRWFPEHNRLAGRIVSRSPIPSILSIEDHLERAYTPEEIGRELSNAGLIVRQIYDAWKLRPAKVCAPRLLVVAQKPHRSTRGAKWNDKSQ
jgi:SAM-dependent methyltransferase